MLLNEQEIRRREIRQELMSQGINPYPPEKFEITTTSDKIKQDFESKPEQFKAISIAGRLMSRRIQGKASFAEIQDGKGRIQIYVNRDEICPEEDKALYNDIWKKKLDLGDIIGIKGYVFKTQTGQVTVHVKELTLLTKSLKPLPLPKVDDQGNVFDAFTDPEKRYRQRYVDLIVNSDVKDTFLKRTKITNTIRQFFNEREYLEVETPILQPIPGGASARPFMTHHNALDIPLYLSLIHI